ncbi:DUF805 domain-containing protein [Lactococcus hircilactis]|uniref:DUF805 domain-containing protein n=1 Tax=Lactococcus hircilactis TaxID=1494462 RepID=UPI0014790972|nr:DUF805 domain-containing protein [Lactococcus hircilactis]
MNLSFVIIRWIFKGLSKLFNLPTLERTWQPLEAVRQSFNDYFRKAAQTWGKANRRDYIVGYLWSMVFMVFVNFVFYKNFGHDAWIWVKQFSTQNQVTLRLIVAPSQSLLIGMVGIVILNLYWLVPWLTLTVRRCRSIGNAALAFVIVVPLGGFILPILCMALPETKRPQRTQEDLDYFKGQTIGE